MPATLHQILPATYNFPANSGFGNLVSRNLTNAGTPLNLNDGTRYQSLFQAMIGYLSEIFLTTAGRGLNSAFLLIPDVTGDRAIEDATFNMTQVTLDIGAIPSSYGNVGKVRGMFRGGYFCFRYNGWCGPLQPIQFQHQIFFPSFPNATGFEIFLRPGLKGDVTYYWQDVPGPPVETEGGLKIRFSDNEIAGLQNTGVIGLDTTNFQTANVKVPYVDATPTLHLAPLPLNQFVNDVALLYSDAPPWLLMLAYASQIWQHIVVPGVATNTHTYAAITESGTLSGVNAFISALQLASTFDADESIYDFGVAGLGKLGYISFKYGAYHSVAQYINNVNSRFNPPMPGATSVFYSLLPRVSSVPTISSSPQAYASIDSARGIVNLVAGDFTGLTGW